VHWTATAFVGIALTLAGCSGSPERTGLSTPIGDDAITVGSFDFPESVLLAELYSQALEAGGFRVERALALGQREFVGPALRAGLIELIPEYAGTALGFASLGALEPTADLASTHRSLAETAAANGITALAPAPGENANTFVVTHETARRHDLAQLSDLAAVADQLVLGGPPECPARPLCLLGLQERYGLEFADFVALDAGGALTHQALRSGDVQVGLLFTTDPALDEYTELADDRRLQPAENVTPLVRSEVIDRWGDAVVDAIDGVSQGLSSDALRRLNAMDAAQPGADDVAGIAAAWLRERR
jgi:osmoprotectant transport system substrate-binding protein